MFNELLQYVNESFMGLSENIKFATQQFVDKDKLSKDDLNDIIELDPTQNKKYVYWIAKQVVDGVLTKDDKNIYELLKEFYRLGNKKLINADITKYSFDELQKLVDENHGLSSQYEKELMDNPNVEIYSNDDDWLIATPLNEEGSIFLGSQTQWCTAYTDSNNYYDNYCREGKKLYVFYDKKTKKKYQAAVDTTGFISELNNAQNTTDDVTQFLLDAYQDSLPPMTDEEIQANNPNSFFNYLNVEGINYVTNEDGSIDINGNVRFTYTDNEIEYGVEDWSPDVTINNINGDFLIDAEMFYGEIDINIKGAVKGNVNIYSRGRIRFYLRKILEGNLAIASEDEGESIIIMHDITGHVNIDGRTELTCDSIGGHLVINNSTIDVCEVDKVSADVSFIDSTLNCTLELYEVGGDIVLSSIDDFYEDAFDNLQVLGGEMLADESFNFESLTEYNGDLQYSSDFDGKDTLKNLEVINGNLTLEDSDIEFPPKLKTINGNFNYGSVWDASDDESWSISDCIDDFPKVTGSINIRFNDFTDWGNLAEKNNEVNGDLNIEKNRFTNFKGSPEFVKGTLFWKDNPIEDFSDMPTASKYVPEIPDDVDMPNKNMAAVYPPKTDVKGQKFMPHSPADTPEGSEEWWFKKVIDIGDKDKLEVSDKKAFKAFINSQKKDYDFDDELEKYKYKYNITDSICTNTINGLMKHLM